MRSYGGHHDTMKVIELHSGFGFDALASTDRPVPTPGRGEILVRMQAASLNYRDLQVVRGVYPQLTLPLIPLSDGAGEVVEVGSDVGRFRVGDRVSPCYVPDWISGPPTPATVARRLGGTVDGVLAEYVCVVVEVGGHDGLRVCADGIVYGEIEGEHAPVLERFEG